MLSIAWCGASWCLLTGEGLRGTQDPTRNKIQTPRNGGMDEWMMEMLEEEEAVKASSQLTQQHGMREAAHRLLPT